MPPRLARLYTGRQKRRRSNAGPRLSDAGASTSRRSDIGSSTFSFSAYTSTHDVPSTAADGSDPPGLDDAGGLLHLQPSELRGTITWKPIVHKSKMQRNDAMDTRLARLGLIHYVQLGHMQLDRSLMQGLAMFWRPETHTFHFSIGEMTVSLEDVAFLLGLPTTGQVVTGRTDYDDVISAMELALPEGISHVDALACFREREGKKAHSILLTALRDKWKEAPEEGWSPDMIDRYTRAFVLELFGCELFPDATGDSVPCIYLQLLRDLHSSSGVKYNWGAAALAMLYRGLDNAALARGGSQIGAPWLLLQLWSYARLLACRPEVTKPFDNWGKPSLDTCSPYGRNWTRLGSRHYGHPHRSGYSYARDVFLKMRPEHIVWRPYEHIKHLMPTYAQVEQRMFLLRVPCIHFWIVMWHHVDRVMHQFMLYQTVPPPPPVAWSRMEMLMGYMHSTFRGRDWHDLFKDEVALWTNIADVMVREDRPWTDTIWAAYLQWFRVHGGVHLVPIPNAAAIGPPKDLGYLHQAPNHMEIVKHILREALRGCAWVQTKGWRRVGKSLLRGCSRSLIIVGEPHRLPRLLESKGLETDIDSILDTDDEEDMPEPGWEEQHFMQRDFSLHDWDTFFDQPRPSQPLTRRRWAHSGSTEPQSETQQHPLPHSQPHHTQPQAPPQPQPQITWNPPYQEYQTYYPPYQTQTQYRWGHSATRPQFGGYNQPNRPYSQTEAYYQEYNVHPNDPPTPISQLRLMTPGGITIFVQSYAPQSSQFSQRPYGESLFNRPLHHPTLGSTPRPHPPATDGPMPRAPTVGLAPAQDPGSH